jgi:hypothetical protein
VNSWDYVPKGAKVKIFYIQVDEQEDTSFPNKSKFDIDYAGKVMGLQSYGNIDYDYLEKLKNFNNMIIRNQY